MNIFNTDETDILEDFLNRYDKNNTYDIYKKQVTFHRADYKIHSYHISVNKILRNVQFIQDNEDIKVLQKIDSSLDKVIFKFKLKQLERYIKIKKLKNINYEKRKILEKVN